MSQTRTTVVISSICAAEKEGSSYSFYFISKILHCCTAALLSIVAALSPPPAANRFRDVIFRRRSPFVDSDFESLPQLYFPSSQPFATSSRRRSLSPPPAAGRFRDFIFRRRSLSSTPSVDAAFRRLLASTTSSSVIAAFRRLLPSTQPFVDSFRRRSPSSTRTCHSFRSCHWHRFFPLLGTKVPCLCLRGGHGRSDGRSVGRINDAPREGPVGLTQEGGKPPWIMRGSVAGFSRFFIMIRSKKKLGS